MSIPELFLKGGAFMWPLLACSIFSLAVILEKLVFYFRNRMNEAKVICLVRQLVADGDLGKISERVPRTRAGLSVFLHSFCRNFASSDLDRRVGLDASRALQREERNLVILSVVGKVAPLIGLLGTVAGLVNAFQRIELKGAQVQPADMAGGIWVALTTTVFGLIVAIPSLIASAWFRNIADSGVRTQELLFEELKLSTSSIAKDSFGPVPASLDVDPIVADSPSILRRFFGRRSSSPSDAKTSSQDSKDSTIDHENSKK